MSAFSLKAQTSFTEVGSSAWINVTTVSQKTTTPKRSASVKKKTVKKKPAAATKDKALPPKKDAFDKTNSQVKRFKKG